MLGISSYWQLLISGLIIFIGFIIQMSKKERKKGGVVHETQTDSA
jgi:ribose/xylose/arabinose/galactoside ABC-type transport system permease subunit